MYYVFHICLICAYACVFLPYLQHGPCTSSPCYTHRPTEFKKRYWCLVCTSINTHGLLMKWVNESLHHAITTQVLPGKHLCVNVCDDMCQWLEQDVVRHISEHTHTVIINEISQKWRYIHRLQHCTLMPRYTSSQWDRIIYTLPWGKRRRRRAQLTMWEGARGWNRATMKKSWSVGTLDEQDRALCILGEQQWINIALDLSPAPSAASSHNDGVDNLVLRGIKSRHS